MSKPKKHIGISFKMSVYDPKKNLSMKDCDWLLDKFIELVENKKWLAGGGSHLVDMNEGGNQGRIIKLKYK